MICGDGGESHHIITKGAGGCSCEINLMPLCRKHHSEIHALGVETFMNKYGLEKLLAIAIEHRNMLRLGKEECV